jgi:hypothetical protein
MSNHAAHVGTHAYYGYDVGIVLLDIKIPRPVGDVGNARSFDFPIDYEVAEGTRGKDMHADPTTRVLRSVVDAAGRVIDRGVKALGTSCGLLAVYHADVVRELSVPIATSSLLQIPLALRMLPAGKKIGVLTIDAPALSPAHFSGVGVSEHDMERVVIAGLENTEWLFPALTRREQTLDVDRAQEEVVAAAARMIEQDPDVGAFVLECTNLCVYSPAIRAELGLPVWDAVGLINWLEAGIAVPARGVDAQDRSR